METTTFMADPTRLMIAAAVGIVCLLVLIIKFKLHPVISMMISAIIIGVGAGMPLTMISDTVEKGVGKTLQGIALLVGLGSMFGGILEVSGGAQKIAQTLIDKYEDKLGTYLMQMSTHEMNGSQAKQVSKFLHTVSDFERLGDHAVNISEVAAELNEKKIAFSDEAQYELDVLENAVKECVSLAVDAFCADDLEMAAKVEPLRELIGILCDELKLRHIARLRTGKCEMKQGFAFYDLLTNLERIAAHCSNIAVAMIELEAADFDTHEYLKSVRELKNDTYMAYFDEYERKYDINGYRKKKTKAQK